MNKITLKITDMHCVNCAMTLQSLEEDLPGVNQVDASYRSGKMAVEFDETALTVDQIITAIQELGYTAEIPTKLNP
jgi:copper chaperone CopZ